MGSGNFVNAAHSVGINSFHFEWCPKYRFALLGGRFIHTAIEESILGTCKQYGMQLLALEVAADHIHLFVNLPPHISVSKALQLLKGRSSRAAFQQCPSFRKVYRKGHFWSPGKFYRSVSNVSGETILRYIKEHQHKELHRSIGGIRAEMKQLSLLSFCQSGNPAL